MTRAAVTVFIETDHEGDAIDVGILFKMALRQAIDGNTMQIVPNRLRNAEPITITVHESMETGMAAGNGYLWLEPTSKAFPRPENQEDEE
jgi:hypothetical protein